MSATKPSTPPTRLRRGETFEGEIETLAYGGRGITKPGGYVVFVNGGLPGDKVRAEITKSKRGYAEANALEIVSPGPDRQADVDIHQGEACPGASWQALDYEKQLAFKEEHVADALTRLEPTLASEGLSLHRLRREWDERFWPYATKGFFPFKDRIPAVLRDLGLT